MKKIRLETKKGDFLLLELPEGATELHIFKDINRPYLNYRLKHETGRFYFEDGDWELIDNIEQLSEDKKCEILEVDFCDLCTLELKGAGYMSVCEGSRCDDTRERIDVDFETFLESIDVHFENPYGMPTPMDYAPYCHMEGGNTTSEMSEDDWIRYESDKKEWQDAQYKLWNKSNTYLFKKT